VVAPGPLIGAHAGRRGLAYAERVDWLIFGGVAIGAVLLGVLAQRLGWIDLSDKNAVRRGGGSGASALGIGDEVFHPTRHEAALELERRHALPSPAPVPGDRPFTAMDNETGDYRGSIRIDVRSRD